MTPRIALSLLLVGCVGQSTSTGRTCTAGMVDVDNVCVSQRVANYVACVRAQGASLGQDRGTKLGIDVGVQAAKAGGVAELKDSLEKKYSVSEASELEIVRTCGNVSGVASNAEPAPAAWEPAPLGRFTFAQTTKFFEKSGNLIARSDFSEGAPALVVIGPEHNSDWQTGTIVNGRFVEEITGTGTWFRWVQPSPAGNFMAHFLVNSKPSLPTGGAYIAWGESGGVSVGLALRGNGAIEVTLVDAGKEVKVAKSGTASFRPRRDQLIDIRHADGRVSIWVEGVEAVKGFEAPFPATYFAIGTTGEKVAVAYDEILVSTLK